MTLNKSNLVYLKGYFKRNNQYKFKECIREFSVWEYFFYSDRDIDLKFSTNDKEIIDFVAGLSSTAYSWTLRNISIKDIKNVNISLIKNDKNGINVIKSPSEKEKDLHDALWEL